MFILIYLNLKLFLSQIYSYGNKILPFITNQTNDIDVLDDFKK